MKFSVSIFAICSCWLSGWSFFILVKPGGSRRVGFDFSRDVWIQNKEKELLLDAAWSEAGLRCSFSLMGMMWLNSAEVSKRGLWHHLNIAEDLPAGLCTSPVSVPDWLQIKCHSSYAGKTREDPFHSMVCIRVKNSNKRDDICHGQAGVSVPALSESFPWPQENGIFLLCLILLLVFYFFSFSFLSLFFLCSSEVYFLLLQPQIFLWPKRKHTWYDI